MKYAKASKKIEYRTGVKIFSVDAITSLVEASCCIQNSNQKHKVNQHLKYIIILDCVVHL